MLEIDDERPELEVWAGLRPCTPDGLPVIGRPVGVEPLVLATGHARKGLSLAPITGRLVAELYAGEPTSIDLAPLSPGPLPAAALVHARVTGGATVGSRVTRRPEAVACLKAPTRPET